MRKRSLLSLLVAFACLLWLGGCGSANGEIGGGTRVGPSTFGLPFLPVGAGETYVIGLKNITTLPAAVYISAYDGGGASYGAANQMFTVPAQGELRVPLSTVAGGGTNGGWVCVDTRDVSNPDPVTGEPTPVPTTGFVFAYVQRAQLGGGAESDATPGLTGRTNGVTLTLTPHTNRVQLLNYTFDQNAAGAVPQASLFAISTFDASGAQVGPTLNQFVSANGTFEWIPTVQLGQVRVEPIGAPFPPNRQIRYGLAARENNLQNHVESRYTEVSTAHWGGLVDTGFEVTFGQDAAGNVHDFALVLSNPTAATESLALIAVYRKDGAPVLTIPRGYVLGAGRTVYMRTTTRDSLGLLQNESSWFDDIFGDVSATLTYDQVTLYVQAPPSLDISARHYDPFFNAFHQVLRSIPRSNRACIFDMPIQVSTAGGTRNYVSITNTTFTELVVPIRAFTPLMGTEYILDSVTVPPLTRIDWSPDGIILREEPTDTVGPPIDWVRLEMTPITGALFRGWTESRDPSQILNYIKPALTRD